MNLEKLTKFSTEIMQELFKIHPSEIRVCIRSEITGSEVADTETSFTLVKLARGAVYLNFITDEVVVSCEIGPDCPFDYMCNVDDMKTGKAETGFCQVGLPVTVMLVTSLCW